MDATMYEVVRSAVFDAMILAIPYGVGIYALYLSVQVGLRLFRSLVTGEEYLGLNDPDEVERLMASEGIEDYDDMEEWYDPTRPSPFEIEDGGWVEEIDEYDDDIRLEMELHRERQDMY